MTLLFITLVADQSLQAGRSVLNWIKSRSFGHPLYSFRTPKIESTKSLQLAVIYLEREEYEKITLLKNARGINSISPKNLLLDYSIPDYYNKICFIENNSDLDS